jgi:hypothetical protein
VLPLGNKTEIQQKKQHTNSYLIDLHPLLLAYRNQIKFNHKKHKRFCILELPFIQILLQVKQQNTPSNLQCNVHETLIKPQKGSIFHIKFDEIELKQARTPTTRSFFHLLLLHASKKNQQSQYA